MALKTTKMIGNIYFITAIAVLGGTLFGFDIASMSAIIGTEQYKCYFNQGPHGPPFSNETECSGPNASTQGGITASMPGGSFFGSILAGFTTDIMGRKTAIQIGAVIWCIGCVITSASQNIAMLCVGRFVNGFAVGICTSLVPVYVSELAPPSKRGRVVGSMQWALTWGMIIIYFISYGSASLDGSPAFRIPWAVQSFPAIFLFIGLFWTPESPRYLAMKDRWEEAHAVLALVHGGNDLDSPFVQRELLEIRQAAHEERNQKAASYLDLFKPDMIYRTHIGMFTQIWSQLTGMNVLMYYITYIFSMAGLSGNVNLYSSSIQYIINMVVTIPALLWVDVIGRRRPIIIAAIILTGLMYLNGALLAVYGSPAPLGGVNHVEQVSWQISGTPSKMLIASTFLFVAVYGATIAPISWIYPPELFPLRLRGKAASVSTASNWIFNFALSYFVPVAFVNIKWKVYIVFGTFLAVMSVHFFCCWPETAGKTLEQVEEIFLSKTKAWNTRVVRKQARDIERTGVKDDDTNIVKNEIREVTHVETTDSIAKRGS